MTPCSPPFDPLAFLTGFAGHLRTSRRHELDYLARIASPEAWIQFEAVAWLHLNRCVTGIRQDAHISAEKDKTDIWVATRGNGDIPAATAIEIKVIYNNKNWPTQVAGLRRDLSPAKQLPREYAAVNATRLGLAVLVYVDYLPGSSDNYAHRFPSPDAFLSAYTQARSAPGTTPFLQAVGQLVSVLELNPHPYLTPGGGSAVWLELVCPAAMPTNDSWQGSA